MAHNHPGSGGEGIAVLQAPLEDIQRGFRMGMSRSIFARSEWGTGDMGSAAKPGGPHVDMDEMPGQARHDEKRRSLSATGTSLRLQRPVEIAFSQIKPKFATRQDSATRSSILSGFHFGRKPPFPSPRQDSAMPLSVLSRPVWTVRPVPCRGHSLSQ